MSYYIGKNVEASNMPEAIEKVTEALKSSGFGIVTTIDMQATLKKKLDVDFKPYTILGACNPNYAHKALQAEDNIGVFLPCNVVVKEGKNGEFEVSAVDPISSMQAVDNNGLHSFGNEIKEMLQGALDKL